MVLNAFPAKEKRPRGTKELSFPKKHAKINPRKLEREIK